MPAGIVIYWVSVCMPAGFEVEPYWVFTFDINFFKSNDFSGWVLLCCKYYWVWARIFSIFQMNSQLDFILHKVNNIFAYWFPFLLFIVLTSCKFFHNLLKVNYFSFIYCSSSRIWFWSIKFCLICFLHFNKFADTFRIQSNVWGGVFSENS